MEHNSSLSAIYLEIANLEDFLWSRAALAPKNGAHTCHKLPRIEGLRQIIVSAALEPRDAVRFVTASRQHDDRDLRTEANASQHFATVSPRQHHVQNDEFIFSFEGVPDAGIPIVDGRDIEAVHAQQLLERGTQLDIIID